MGGGVGGVGGRVRGTMSASLVSGFVSQMTILRYQHKININYKNF